MQLDVRLPEDEVHVWRASLDQEPGVVRDLERHLSRDELDRADRFRFVRDRRRYVAGRGILRNLLGAYLNTPAKHVGFRYGAFGKPLLHGPGPWFNVSHSGPLALFAFASGFEIGVDVELAQAQPEGERIAEHFFAPAEVSLLRSLPGDQQDAAFLACWTRKEAFIKARGDGLTLPLEDFDVGFGPGRSCRLRRTAWSADEPAQWQLVDISDRSCGYLAAVAARDCHWRVVTRNLHRIPVPDQFTTLQEMT
jgi:4'-phosphopantetheinyl transferase